MKTILQKKISLIYTILLMASCMAVTFFLTNYFSKENQAELQMEQSIASSDLLQANTQIARSCNYEVQRINGYQYIRPILFVDDKCQSDNLLPMKETVVSLIDNFKKSGTVNAASVYLRDISLNEWFAINDEESYKPGSLLKVPELITFLKMNEKQPGLLDRKITYSRAFDLKKKGLYLSKSIEVGHTYTIRELLTYMITYSDNNATQLLNDIIDVPTFQKTFTDLGLEAPDWNSSDYPITAKHYSMFLRALYNGCYLSSKDSEFATELLTHCDFKNGILNGLPSNTKIAHKFGEAGMATEQQLHESAIIYLQNKTYILTVMTRGTNPQKLPAVLSQISNVVYQAMSENTSNL